MPPHPARPLLFLDYDGTLAPIVDDPAEAWPHPDVPGLLRQLAERHPVVVVSGRDLAALARFLPDVHVRAAGLHGAEVGVLGEVAQPSLALRTVQADLDRLRRSVPEMEGVRVEEKGAAFAVHYRAAPDDADAQQALRRWSADLPEALHAVWGKKVVELRPREVSKGTAVTAIAREHPEHTPVYLGDDTTDEDAFAALHSFRLGAEAGGPVTIKVGEGGTAARFRVPDVDATVAYLRGFLV
ncbi:MAG: trehalose-phosphatase [Bacteroidota bacterium]